MVKGQKRAIRANRPDWRTMKVQGRKQKEWVAVKGGERDDKPGQKKNA